MENFRQIKQFCEYLSLESGKIIFSYFRKKISIDVKEDSSPVTIADKSAEEKMRELIMKEYPDHGIIGEEFGTYNDNSEYKWVLDPIDGTKSFISGALSFGTLIALLKDGKPILGVINQPILKEFLVGYENTCLLNDQPVSLRECSDLSKATLLVTDHIDIGKFQKAEPFECLINSVNLYRNWGDCYGYYLVATGFADIMMDPVMSDWDKMALIPIIKAAGGEITDYQGNDPIHGTSTIASNPAIHKKVIEILNPQE